VLHAETHEPEALALVAGSLAELTARMGPAAIAEFDPGARAGFASWLGGDLLVLRRDGQTVAGGAYRRYDSTTAQFAWLWTRPDHRRRGLGRRVLEELEHSASWRGYGRAYAVAGPGQGEGRLLLGAGGFRALAAAGEQDGLAYLGFVKDLGRGHP
jgi:GNAT superfamily N-acetyltransferase